MFTSTSMRPNRPRTAATAVSTDSASVTSRANVSMRFSNPSRTAAPSRSGFRIVAATRFPRAAHSRAAAAPNPRDAPVISTTLSPPHSRSLPPCSPGRRHVRSVLASRSASHPASVVPRRDSIRCVLSSPTGQRIGSGCSSSTMSAIATPIDPEAGRVAARSRKFASACSTVSW